MSDELARTLMVHMIQTGKLDLDDINQMADTLDAAGYPDAAHLARMTYFEAHAPTQSDWEAQRHRSRFRVVDNPD